MKKRKYVAFAACLLSLLLVFGVVFAGCGENGEHTHKLDKTAAVTATCTENGNTEYYKCSECGKYFSDAQGNTEIQLSDTVVTAKGHDLKKVDAIAATCTSAGKKEHYKCSVCGALFASDGKTPTTEAELNVPATAHDYEDIYTFDDNKHWHACADCGAADEKMYHGFTLTLDGGKREYNKGEALDTSGMTGTLGCGTCEFTKTFNVTSDMVSGYAPATPGSQTLTVTWQGSDGEYTRATATYEVTVSDVAAKCNVTLENATFADGAETKELESGSGLPADVKLLEGKTFVGWYDRTDNVWYGEEVIMPAKDVTLTAVYENDLTAFTPACVIENMADGQDKRTLSHEDFEGVQATRFAFEGGVTSNLGFKILNGDSSVKDGCTNVCPLYEDHGGLLMLTVKNDGETSVSFKYQIEFWGVRGEKAIGVGAGETVTVPLIYGATPPGKGDNNTPFNQIIFTETIESNVSLLICGKYYTYSKYGENTLTFEGATYNGETSVTLENGSTLSGDAEITLTDTEKTFVGWKVNDKVYLNDEELTKGFVMPASECTVKAVYAEDMSVYTPSCIYKDKSKNDSEKKTGVHNEDGSTTYTIDLSVEKWAIYNGSDEKHTEISNMCPVSTTVEKLYYMTFVNEGESDITIEIGPEYFGLKYSVTVTVPAGETVTQIMKLGTFGVTQNTTFWEFHNKAVSDGTVDLTISGRYA